jgi:GTPase SAR1 family protein
MSTDQLEPDTPETPQTREESAYQGYEQVALMRQQVIGLIDRQTAVVGDLEQKTQRDRWLPRLAEVRQRVAADTFKVMVVGQFSRGKSTFINALIGRKVLPSYATATTAVINEIKFGERPAVLLYPRPGPDDKAPPPVEVPVEDLENYVTVDEENIDKPNPYLKAELFWPIDLCRFGVELIDSPGLDAEQVHDELTIGYLSQVDAVVMILDATAAATNTELLFFETRVKPLGHEDAFWVVNKINLAEEDRERVKRAVARRLAPLVKSERRIFYIDAKGALAARIANDRQALAATGLNDVESALEDFLTTQRGRVKVLVPVRQLQQSVREVRNAIRDEEGMLSQEVQTLTAAYHSNEIPLAELRKLSELLVGSLRQKYKDLVAELDGFTERYLSSLPGRLPKLMEGFSPEAKVSLLHPQQSVRAITEPCIEELQRVIGADLVAWQQGELQTFLKTRLDLIQTETWAQIREFEKSLQKVKASLLGAGALASDAPATPSVQSIVPTGIGRDFAAYGLGTAVGGLIVGGVMTFGFGAIAAGILGALGIGALLPVVIAVIAVGAVVAALKDASPKAKLVEIARKAVVAKAGENIADQAPKLRKQFVAGVTERLESTAAEFESSLDAQVAALRESVEKALKAKAKGEHKVAERKRQIGQMLVELGHIDAEIDRIVAWVVRLDDSTPVWPES